MVIDTVAMSSKGLIVIPENIRKQLGLKSGAQFIVMGEKDYVILKNVTLPSFDEYDHLAADARREAKKAGMRRSDIEEAIEKHRKKR